MAGVSAPAPHRPEGLTPTERRVLRLIAQGLSSQQVAERLFVSRRTVDFHLGNVYRFLEAGNRIQAINAARGKGWI